MPNHNFTTISGVTVKEERHDEAEINEMAAKMKETHRQATAKAAAAQIVAATGRIPPGMPGTATNGQSNIMNYLTRKVVPPPQLQQIGVNNSQDLSKPKNETTTAAADAEKKPTDEESVKGRFGWTTFGKTHIPFILRQNEKYCSVRMVESKLLNNYLNSLHADIYSCTCVRSYYITEAESRLLNEINHKHCESSFSREMFTLKDLVVRLSDATKFYQFLDICYKKLIMGTSGPSDKCGFIRINKESVVPYTVRDGEKFVPLFYFEGETENLKLKAESLSGWDLSYLKFCCKVQGIRNELFASDSVHVISLVDIKSYFPTGTEFEDYWPSKVVDHQLLMSAPRNNNNARHWTKQPQAPPPKQVINTVTKNVPQVRKQPPAYGGIVQGRMAPNATLTAQHDITAAAVQVNHRNSVTNRTESFMFKIYRHSLVVGPIYRKHKIPFNRTC